MSDILERAKLLPYQSNGSDLEEASHAIELDFNPETLTQKVQNSLESPGRRGRQRRQYVGSSTTTLSFDAYFDTTRPKTRPGDRSTAGTDEDLDVRYKTARIAELLHVPENERRPAPRRVRFLWGSIVFDGVLQTYSEVLEYFSPEGIPLRAKVSIALTEQKFQYQIDATKTADTNPFVPTVAGGFSADGTLIQLGVALSSANAVAGQNGLDSLLDIAGSGGLTFDAGVEFGVGVELGAEFGIGVDLGVTAGAAVDLSAAASIDVFGGASIEASFGADVDLGLDLSATASVAGSATASLGGALSGISGSGAPGSGTASAWAPDGPTPGTQASEVARAVQEARTVGATVDRAPAGAGAFVATSVVADVTHVSAGAASYGDAGQDATVRVANATVASALPIKGSPRTSVARFGPPTPPGLFSGRGAQRVTAVDASSLRRPRWEGVAEPSDAKASAGDRAVRSSGSRRAQGGCC